MSEELESGEQPWILECAKCKKPHAVCADDCNACAQLGVWICCDPPTPIHKCKGCSYAVCTRHSSRLKDESVCCTSDDGELFCAHMIIEKRLGIVQTVAHHWEKSKIWV